MDLLIKFGVKATSIREHRRKGNKLKSMLNNFIRTDQLLYMKFNLDYSYW